MQVDEIKSQLKVLKDEAQSALRKIESDRELEEWRVQYLGKKSQITQVSRQMGGLEPSLRPVVGEIINEAKNALEAEFEEIRKQVEQRLLAERFAAETIDVTMPGRKPSRGAVHPLTRVIQEIEDIFLGMGFEIAVGPEVESDYYNFEMLNLPKDHPARDMQDTFYITEELLLRTHTSPMQVRTMEKMRPFAPVKVLVPGRVYRRDEDDATHSHAFMQIEGLVVDENISMSHLKGTLEAFAKAMFGSHQEVRLRPSFFPFTEPSAEVDLRCIVCDGKGCRTCKDTGWIEILGSGMVHPHVLDGAGYDSKKYSGFAFGMGVERIAMLKYGVEDVRHFYQNDLRFVNQFRKSN